MPRSTPCAVHLLAGGVFMAREQLQRSPQEDKQLCYECDRRDLYGESRVQRTPQQRPPHEVPPACPAT